MTETIECDKREMKSIDTNTMDFYFLCYEDCSAFIPVNGDVFDSMRMNKGAAAA